jgi:hypothetical protein
VGTSLVADLIRAVSYRDGRVCRLPAVYGGPSDTCPPVGYAPPASTPVSEQQVASAVAVGRAERLCRGPQSIGAPVPCSAPGSRGQIPEYVVPVTFIANIAIPNIASHYNVAIQYPGGPNCITSLSVGPTQSDLHAGQHATTLQYIPAGCTRPMHGWVSYKPQNGPAVTVGRFTIKLP